MSQFVTKTRVQLINMILANASVVNCYDCNANLGKFVMIACDEQNTPIRFFLCRDCDRVRWSRFTWWTAIRLWIQRLMRSTEVPLQSPPPPGTIYQDSGDASMIEAVPGRGNHVTTKIDIRKRP